jgi:hypothetical protein
MAPEPLRNPLRKIRLDMEKYWFALFSLRGSLVNKVHGRRSPDLQKKKKKL